MLDSTFSLSEEALEKTSTTVAVIQGSKDRIIHQDVPKRILEGLTSDRCSVHYLDQFGHSGNPDDENGYIATPAGPIAAEFFEY
jgi:esterase/lipase